jgi:hypothetical protein
MMNLVMVCPFCSTKHNVEVKDSDVYKYIMGAPIQRAFPYLTATQREQIISDMCPDCQKRIFGEDEDE